MTIEQTPEINNTIDSALNNLWEWVNNTVRIHELFWELNEKQTEIAQRLLNNTLDKVA